MDDDLVAILLERQRKALADARGDDTDAEEALLEAAMIEGLFAIDRIARAAERIADALERQDPEVRR